MFVELQNFRGYLVNDSGVVVSLRKGRWKELKPMKTAKGYLRVEIQGRGYRIHRLVLLAWSGHSNLEVNHKNGVKTDNRLENLEYCSRLANMRHAGEAGLRKYARGEKQGNAKLTDEQAHQILLMKGQGLLQKEVAAQFGVSRSLVSLIWRGVARKHLTEKSVC